MVLKNSEKFSELQQKKKQTIFVGRRFSVKLIVFE